MSEQLQKVAGRIKEIREVCGYQAEEIAARLNISAEKYRSYESSGANIPISVMYEMANLYGVDIMELLTGNSPRLSDYCVVRQGQSTGVDRYPGYHFESLAFKFKRRIMEPLMVSVTPGDEDMSPITHQGQEFNFVVEGSVAVIIGGEEITLHAGDCVYFDPTIPHGQRAAGGKPAKFLTVIAE